MPGQRAAFAERAQISGRRNGLPKGYHVPETPAVSFMVSPDHGAMLQGHLAWPVFIPVCGIPGTMPAAPLPAPLPAMAMESLSADTPSVQPTQDRRGSSPVLLRNLPASLCTAACMDVMLEQAGVDDDLISCDFQAGEGGGEALLTFANWEAAEQCVKHFHGCQWDSAGRPVTAEFGPAPGMWCDAGFPACKAVDKTDFATQQIVPNLGGHVAVGTGSGKVDATFQAGVVVDFDVQDPQKQTGNMSWANYVIGVVDELRKLGVQVGGFDAFLTSNVPPGAGVSSSAAVEMATAKLLAQLYPSSVGSLDNLALIQAAKAAENNFVGMGCGILDQFSSGMGRAGQLLFLDCRTLDYDYVPFKGAQFVLANTHAPHQLVDGKYGELRKNCFEAADAMRSSTGNTAITHLRDIDVETFEVHSGRLSVLQRSISKHIVMENSRVQEAIKALKAGDMRKLGEFLSKSHESSRDDFGNSCKELDLIQQTAEGIDGFLGARLMGGGFGGSTINLVQEGKAEAFAKELSRRYQEKTGTQPTTMICLPGNGAFSEALA